MLGLEEEKKKIQTALDDISRRFRAPMDDTTYTGSHPYALWGLATSSLDYYIFRSSDGPDGPSERQWWHIKYIYDGDDASITRTRVLHEEVLSKASSDSGRVLLVYANEAATSVTPISLSASLEKFVKKDNLNWLQDYQDQNSGWTDDNAEAGSWMNSGEHKVNDDWMTDEPPGYDGAHGDHYNWNSMSAKEFHEQADSGVSSTTLTPNTEVDDDGVDVVEMQEINGGNTAWTDPTLSNASSDALGVVDPMDISDETKPNQEATEEKDVEMADADADTNADAGATKAESRVEHIEMVEKKGG
jgi:hypothetical protein